MQAIIELVEEWKQQGKTQTELAQAIGAPFQHLSNWKTGIRPMSESTFAQMAEIVVGIEEAPKWLWRFVKEKSQEAEASFNMLVLQATRRLALLW